MMIEDEWNAIRYQQTAPSPLPGCGGPSSILHQPTALVAVKRFYEFHLSLYDDKSYLSDVTDT